MLYRLFGCLSAVFCGTFLCACALQTEATAPSSSVKNGNNALLYSAFVLGSPESIDLNVDQTKTLQAIPYLEPSKGSVHGVLERELLAAEADLAPTVSIPSTEQELMVFRERGKWLGYKMAKGLGRKQTKALCAVTGAYIERLLSGIAEFQPAYEIAQKSINESTKRNARYPTYPDISNKAIEAYTYGSDNKVIYAFPAGTTSPRIKMALELFFRFLHSQEKTRRDVLLAGYSITARIFMEETVDEMGKKQTVHRDDELLRHAPEELLHRLVFAKHIALRFLAGVVEAENMNCR